MLSRHSIAVLAIAVASTIPGTASAQSVGELNGVAAWVNKMPPGPPSLHIIGTITAPTPCHEAVTEHTGDSTSNPPGYMLRVTFRDTGEICIQMLADISFHHIEENYTGNHTAAEVSSEADSETVDIQEVQ